MFVRFYLKSNDQMYSYDSVSVIDLGRHKFPSGKDRKCITFVLNNGNTINFPFSEIADLVVENFEDEVHPYDDNAKILFVEDGEAYERL